MEINKGLLCQVGPVIGLSKNDMVICCQEITLLKKNKSKEEAFLATEFSVYLFKCSKNGKSYSVYIKFDWTELERIDFIQKNQFSMTYSDGTIKIQHHGASYLLTLIVSYLKSILNPQELPEMDLPSQILSEIEIYPDSFIKRFRYKLLTNGQKIPEDLISALEKQTTSSELDMNKLPPSMSNYFDLILSCLQVEPNIFSLVLPTSCGHQSNHWSQLSNCLRYNTTLQILVTSDKLESNNVKNLCESLTSNKESKLNKFAFVETEITEQQLPILAKLLTETSAESLLFDKSLNSNTLHKFATSHNYSNIFQKLKSFTLKEITVSNIRDILKVLRNASIISFIDCNVNIDDVINEMSSMNCTSLTIIGGISAGKFAEKAKLNRNLSYLKLSKIVWNSAASFCAAWKIIIGHPNDNFKLVLQRQTIVNDMDQVYKTIGSSSSSHLESFSWEMNPIEPSMFPFFIKSNHIKNLTLNGSVNSTNCVELAKILVKMPKLIHLSIDGSSENKMNEMTVNFLHEIVASKSLEELSIKNNGFGDSGMNELTNFLMKNLKVSKISFDGNKISKPESFIHFFETLTERGPSLNFRFPNDDLESMKKNHLIKSSKINHLTECYEIIISGNTSVVQRPNSDDQNKENEFDNCHKKSSDDAFMAPGNRSSSSIGSGVFKNAEWIIDLPPIKEFNGTKIINGILSSFTLSAANSKLKDTL